MKAKRLGAIVLAAALSATMFAGCGKQTPASSSGVSGASASNAYKNHLTISIAHWGVGTSMNPTQKDDLRDALCKKFNVTITPANVTWDDYKTKLNTWAAAGTLPDVFSDDAIQESNFTKWCTEGVVRTLPSDLSAYPALKKYMGQSDVQNYKYPLGSSDGKFYCVPRPCYSNIDLWAIDTECMIRKDWMKKIGIDKLPENMDEFTALMKAYVQKDPDGNGKNDTIGCTTYTLGYLKWFFLGYEPCIDTWTLDSSSKWIPGFMTDRAVEGITAFKKLYDAGGLDKDLPSLKGSQGEDKFTSGVAGAICTSGCPDTWNAMFKDMLKAKPGLVFNDTVAELKPFKAADGNYYRDISSSAWSETYFKAGTSDEKVARILAMLDFGMTDAGSNMINLGIEGVDYKMDNGKIVLLDHKDSNGKAVVYPCKAFRTFFSWYQDFQYVNPQVPSDIQKTGADQQDWLVKNCKAKQTNLGLSFLQYDGKDKTTFSFTDEIVKAIVSKDAAAEWKQMVANYKKAGYDTAIANLNTAAQKTGMTDVTEK